MLSVARTHGLLTSLFLAIASLLAMPSNSSGYDYNFHLNWKGESFVFVDDGLCGLTAQGELQRVRTPDGDDVLFIGSDKAGCNLALLRDKDRTVSLLQEHGRSVSRTKIPVEANRLINQTGSLVFGHDANLIILGGRSEKFFFVFDGKWRQVSASFPNSKFRIVQAVCTDEAAYLSFFGGEFGSFIASLNPNDGRLERIYVQSDDEYFAAPPRLALVDGALWLVDHHSVYSLSGDKWLKKDFKFEDVTSVCLNDKREICMLNEHSTLAKVTDHGLEIWRAPQAERSERDSKLPDLSPVLISVENDVAITSDLKNEIRTLQLDQNGTLRIGKPRMKFEDPKILRITDR